MEKEIDIIPDHSPVVIEDDIINVEALENTLKAKLRSDSPLSDKCCIFRVPQVLRRHKPEAYEPDVVSIGPFHRGGKQYFEPMENVKHWYVHNFLSRLNISMKTLIQGIDNITEFEKRTRDFYAEPLDHLSQNDLIEIMILDGCFLVELFWKFRMGNGKYDDPIVNMACLQKYIFHDLMLLENQLPWFVLEYLHGLAVEQLLRPSPLKMLVLNFSAAQSMRCTCKYYLKHGLEHDDGGGEILHILDLLRTAMVFQFKVFTPIFSAQVRLPTATTLSEAGVKFEKGSTDDGIMNINFKDGVFTIPQLTIAELSEPLFRNLIAFEQCYHGRSHEILSYAILMDNLIGSCKDIDFLCEREIILNWFSSESASQLFNSLYDDTFLVNFSYGGLCAEVNKYYNVSWNRWLEKLKRDYFANPWTITSLVAAFILLVLTLLQTAYTIQTYYFPRY